MASLQMSRSVSDALQNLDALLSSEAAQLTSDELQLVTDMVEQLMGASITQACLPQDVKGAAAAGMDLTAQVHHVLDDDRQLAAQKQVQQQQQQQHLPQQPALDAQFSFASQQRGQHHSSMQQEGQRHKLPAAELFPGAATDAAAATATCVVTSTGSMQAQHKPELALRVPVAAEVTGLASPSSSSISGCSSPASPSTRQPSRPVATPRPAALTAGPAQLDRAAQAAADVLTAALADPTASVEDIVGIFDKVLTAGEKGGRELQKMLASTHHLQQQQQHPAQTQRPYQPTCKQDTRQQPQMQVLDSVQQPPVSALSSVAADVCAGQLQRQGNLSGPASGPTISQEGMPASAPSSTSRSAPPKLPGRPSTAPAPASSLPVTPQHAESRGKNVRMPGHVALVAATAAHRSQSPDVFRRLSAAAPRSSKLGASGDDPPRNSSSPTEIERNWLDSLRGAGGAESCSPDRGRSSSSRSGSRSRSGSPAVRQPAQQSHVPSSPWLTAAAVHEMRRSCPPLMAPCAVEWDADLRSIKAAPTTGSGSSGSRQPGQRRPGGTGRSPAARSSNTAAAAAAAEAAAAASAKAHGSSQKEPVKLPPHVIEQRMRRFYERNLDWKRRCSLVYQRQREELKEGETAGCTFAPVINKHSEKIAQELRTSYPMRPVRPLTPLASSVSEREEQQQQQQHRQQQQQQRRCASTGRLHLKQKQKQSSAWMYDSEGSGCVVPRYAGGGQSTNGGCGDQTVPPAVRRLFQDAAVRMQRAQQYKDVTLKAERQARAWSAPRRPAAEGVPPRVYDHLNPEHNTQARRSKSPATDGCLFRPWTNPRPKPKSQQVHPAADKQQLVDCCEHEELVLEEFVALLDTAGNDAPQQQNQDGAVRELPARPGTAPAAAFGSQQQQVRSPSATRIGSTSKNTDLDWSEFIDRQSRFISRKEAKVKAVTAYTYGKTASPELSPGTKRILADKQLLSVGSGSPHSPSDGSRFGQLIGASSSSPGTQQSPDGNDFLGRLEHQSRSVPGTTATGNERSTQYMLNRKHSSSSSRGNGRDGHLPEDCTFRPSITSKAAAKKGRSVEEMSEGDRLRKEVKLEQLRVLNEARELAGATFRPDLSPSRQREGEEYESVPARLKIKNGGLNAYMASLQEKRRLLDERRKAAERRKQEEELRECTFTPVTTPVPAYISELAEVGYTARYIDRVMQGAWADAAGGNAGRVAGGQGAQAYDTTAPLSSGSKGAKAAAAAAPDKYPVISTRY